MTRAKILFAICRLFFLLNCGDGMAACRRYVLFQLMGLQTSGILEAIGYGIMLKYRKGSPNLLHINAENFFAN